MVLPDFRYEKRVWKRGFSTIGGADEVGRGAFAGPIVAAVVVWPRNFQFLDADSVIINDSKKLNLKQRELADSWIKSNCLAWGIGEVSVSSINRLGMAKASKMVFRKAVSVCRGKLGQEIEYLLVDAFYIPYTKGIKRKNQLAIVKGDQKSFSIAAASIIAKVYRDRLMKELSERHKEYGWEKNVGYGTKSHSDAILKYGPTRLHRKDFIRKLIV